MASPADNTVQGSSSRLFWLILLSVFLPPLAVALEFGVFTWDTFWNLLLTLFVPFGGFIHSIYLLTSRRYHNQGYIQVGSGTEDAEGSNPAPTPRDCECEGSQSTQAAPVTPSTHAAPPPYISAEAKVTPLDNKIQRNV